MAPNENVKLATAIIKFLKEQAESNRGLNAEKREGLQGMT